MYPNQRAVDYTRIRHWMDQCEIALAGNGWMANLAHRAGLLMPIQVVSYALTLPLPLPHPPPLRIAFASDFHAGPITHPSVIDEACNRLQQLAPDMILLGGDFVSLRAHYCEVVTSALAGISAPLGRYAVLGNHDLWANEQPVRAALQQAQIHVLINQTLRLPAPYEHIMICGLDDPTSGSPDAAALFDDTLALRIVLMHSPEGLAHIQHAPFDLAFCGHTHGGQICLPNGEPLWLPKGSYNRQYPAGRYHIGPRMHQQLIVSRGVGYGGLPIRLFAPTDIVLCTIGWS